MVNETPTDKELLDGKVHRVNIDGPASVVAEYSYVAGMNLLYIRYDNGDVGVMGVDGEEQATLATISDGRVVIQNPQLAAGGIVPKDKESEYARMISDLVDGAFPKGATEIVPILDRKSGSTANIGYLSTRTIADVNMLIEGNGYRVSMLEGSAVFERVDSRGKVTESLSSLQEGAIQYNDSKVPNTLEPMVLDLLNSIPGAKARDNILLAGKVLADGVIDPQEAKEVGAAMQRAKSATKQELQEAKADKGLSV